MADTADIVEDVDPPPAESWDAASRIRELERQLKEAHGELDELRAAGQAFEQMAHGAQHQAEDLRAEGRRLQNAIAELRLERVRLSENLETRAHQLQMVANERDALLARQRSRPDVSAVEPQRFAVYIQTPSRGADRPLQDFDCGGPPLISDGFILFRDVDYGDGELCTVLIRNDEVDAARLYPIRRTDDS